MEKVKIEPNLPINQEKKQNIPVGFKNFFQIF